ncbi:MAG: ribosome small subunit-dependent GTPase A [Deltaproteobacteria bacterium]|nr:ribosome small subunit-dependent GTPase A [Deltaproteobacteria bacterium]
MARRPPPPRPPAASPPPLDVEIDEQYTEAEGEAALSRALDRGAAGPSLAALGWDLGWAQAAAALDLPGCAPARVAVEHRGRLVLLDAGGSRLAFAPQGAQYDSADPAAALLRPRVGDWVLVPEGETPRVAALLPRRTALLRQIPRRRVAVQVVAANLDLLVVVAAWGQELNLRRIERYLAAAEASGAAVLVVVNKLDLAPPDVDPVAEVQAALGAVPVLGLSARAGDGVEALLTRLGPGRTLGLVGSSGVGKSSIANALLGRPELAVGAVRADDEKGRHTTTHRELVVLPARGAAGESGGVLIDTPGMRELQLWDGSGVDRSFEDLHARAEGCKFRGCTHTREAGCALLAAITEGELEMGRLASYRKLMAEVRAKEEAAKRRRDPRRAAPERWHPRDWRPDEGGEG